MSLRGHLEQAKDLLVIDLRLAASYLQHNGYENVINVLGGMGAWKAAGFPVV